MRHLSNSWTRVLRKFGITHKRFNSRLSRKYSQFRKLCFEHCEDRRLLAVFTVTNSNDAVENTPAAIGTLRQAVFDANFIDDQDTIVFALPPNEDTITLTQGDLDITENLIINGPGRDISGNFLVTISGNNSSRIFEVLSTSLEINGLKLTDGSAVSFPDSEGGAVRSLQSDITIRDSEISGNQATTGGGLYVDAYDNQIEIRDSIISGNSSTLQGGGIRMDVLGASQALIDSTTIADNYVGYQPSIAYSAGGLKINVAINGQFTMSRSTVSGNTSYGGSGGISIDNEGDILIVNSTISGNQSVGGGGGLSVNDETNGVTRISHSTVVFNTAGFMDGSSGLITPPVVKGGGLSVSGDAYTGITRTVLDHTIVANNADKINRDPDPFGLDAPTPDVFIATGARDDGGTIVQQNISAAFSLIGDAKGGNNGSHPSNPDGIIVAIASGAMIGPAGVDQVLKDNGGPTLTHMPLSGSFAIDGGNPSISNPPGTDQRGFGRIADGDGNGSVIIDIGAVEKDSLPLVDAPTIVDVIIDRRGTNPWHSTAEVSFAERVAYVTGSEQFRPISTRGVNTTDGADTLEIVFSEDVFDASGNELTGSELALHRTRRFSNGAVVNEVLDSDDFSFSYDPMTFTGTWTFNSTLLDGKYSIRLSDSVQDAAGNSLDADWVNDHNGTPDYYQDDPQRSFNYNVASGIGNGTPGTNGGEFRFHFALLAGDYDGDGFVEHGAESATGDGNADGVVDGNDVSIGFIYSMLPLRSVGGADFNDDEKVDGIDLSIWQNGYGTNAAGDVDGDGDTDGADFLLWQRVFGTCSVWADSCVYQSYAEAMAAVLGVTLEDLTVGLTPKVFNVIISGSTSVHAPYSFDTVDGSGSQIAAVPVGGADTISIVFSEAVNVSSNSLIVVGLRTANVPQLAEFSYDSLTFTASWQFESWALGDNYLLYLQDSITDMDGNFLDGEWTNPASLFTTNSAVSTFPSGDGITGGTFNFVMTLLPDINGDNIVNYTEYYSTYYRWYYGAPANGFVSSDFNGDGVIDESDYQLVLDNMFTNLQNLSILADMDADGDVDADDLGVVSDNYGMTGATWADGDLDGDGEITDADLDLVFAQYGLWLNMVS